MGGAQQQRYKLLTILADTRRTGAGGDSHIAKPESVALDFYASSWRHLQLIGLDTSSNYHIQVAILAEKPKHQILTEDVAMMVPLVPS